MKQKPSRNWLIVTIPVFIALFAAVALLIPSFARYPERADDGAAWDRDWEMLGTVLGVEAPQNGFTLLNNDTVLAGDDTYYASWVSGEATPYVNADGKDVDLYPAQIYLLLYGCADEAAARDAVAEWTAREEETYAVRERREENINARDYALLLYDCGSETNPYSRGISAFTQLGHYAVIAELTCTAEFDGDEQALLAEFLRGCHYSSESLK